MMKILSISIVVSTFIVWLDAKPERNTPFLKRAYCSCVCCNDNPDQCYRDPSIEEDYACVSDDCTEEFCERLREVKCSTSCYCSKCKDSLPQYDETCETYYGIEPNCECGDMDKIKCETDDDFSSKEVQELTEIKKQSQCMVQCYCLKCRKDLPTKFQNECVKEKYQVSNSNCTCKRTICPTKEQLEMLEQLGSSNGDTKEVFKSDNLKSNLCKMECFCNSCKWNNPEMERMCDRILSVPNSGCPSCPENLECPDLDPEANCKMHCFCQHCVNDKRMPASLKTKCKETMKSTTEICPCHEKVDCQILNQVEQHQKKLHSPSEESIPKPGKLKQKTKLWDEL